MAIGNFGRNEPQSNNDFILSLSADETSTRTPKCARCRNHGFDKGLKGHKEKCEFKECVCRSCLVVVERQKITAARVAHLRYQRKMEAKKALYTNMGYTQSNPLTEEEEFVLSSQLQAKKKNEKVSIFPGDKKYHHIKSEDEPLTAKSWSSYPVFNLTAEGHNSHYNSSRSFSDHCCPPNIANKYDHFKIPAHSSFYRHHVYAYNPYHPHHFVHTNKPLSRGVLPYKANLPSTSTPHHRRKIRRPSKAFFVKTDVQTDSEDEEVDVVMETSSQKPNSIFDYEKKLEVLKVLFPELGLNQLRDLFDEFNGDIQAAVEFLLAKKRARDEKDPSSTNVSKPFKTCHRIETLISKKEDLPIIDEYSKPPR